MTIQIISKHEKEYQATIIINDETFKIELTKELPSAVIDMGKERIVQLSILLE